MPIIKLKVLNKAGVKHFPSATRERMSAWSILRPISPETGSLWKPILPVCTV